MFTSVPNFIVLRHSEHGWFIRMRFISLHRVCPLKGGWGWGCWSHYHLILGIIALFLEKYIYHLIDKFLFYTLLKTHEKFISSMNALIS